MNIKKLFGKSNASASMAKDRLSIIIEQHKSDRTYPDYLRVLRHEIVQLVMQHTHAEQQQIDVNYCCKENNSILALNIVLPEQKNNQKQS